MLIRGHDQQAANFKISVLKAVVLHKIALKTKTPS